MKTKLRSGVLIACAFVMMLAGRAVAGLVPGEARGYYDPANGHVLLDANNVAIWYLKSPTPVFIGVPTDLDPGADVRWTIPGTLKQADAFKVGELILENSIVSGNAFNSSTLQYEYTGALSDLGQLLPVGWTPDDLTGVFLHYNTLSNPEAVISLFVVPEPTTISLTALAVGGWGILGVLRRTRDRGSYERK